MKIWQMNRSQKIIFFALFLWAVGFGLYVNLWPIHIRNLGGSPVTLGLLTSIAMLMSTLAALPGGILADKFERKKIILWGWGLGVPAPLFFAWAPNWEWLVPGIFFYNASLLCMPAIQSYLARTVTTGNAGAVYATVFSAFPLGMLVSPYIGALLAELWGIRFVFLVAFGFYLVSTVVMILLEPQIPQCKTPQAVVVRWDRSLNLGNRFYVLALFFALIIGVQNLIVPFAVPYLRDVLHLDVPTVGLIGSLVALSTFVFSPLLGRLSDNRSLSMGIAIGLGAFAVSSLMTVYFAHVLYLVVAAYMLRGLGQGLNHVMTAAVGRLLPADNLGLGFGVYNVIVGCAMITSPYIGGWVYASSPQNPFLISAGLFSLMVGAVALWGRHILRTEPNVDASH